MKELPKIGDCLLVRDMYGAVYDSVCIESYSHPDGYAELILEAYNKKTEMLETLHINSFNLIEMWISCMNRVENLHFFSLDDLVELFKEVKEVFLIGICEQEESTRIFLKINNTKYQIAWFKTHFETSKMIQYVYMAPISDKTIDFLSNNVYDEFLMYFPVNKTVKAKKLTKKGFCSFCGIISGFDYSIVKGINLEYVIIYDFCEKENRDAYGHGIMPSLMKLMPGMAKCVTGGKKYGSYIS